MIRVNMNTPQAVGLFAGIGGLELGLAHAGITTTLLCEIDAAATAVLKARFPGIPIHDDVCTLKRLPPDVDVLVGGFPCQDLSQAGTTTGISGSRSGLVDEVLRLASSDQIRHVLLENVSFMLHLHRGEAMRHVLGKLESLGFSLAYRVLDSRAFGVPQRRERVYILASRDLRPEQHLLSQDAGAPPEVEHDGRACGFYWTEGVRGLGWAVDAVPTLKGGSTIGIPSPPGIWMPCGEIVTPDLRDAERLQGFSSGWTTAADGVSRRSSRWKLVGNAVTVNTARWVGERFVGDPRPVTAAKTPLRVGVPWPRAAFGSSRDGRFSVEASAWPIRKASPALPDFLRYEPKLLSHRAVAGFIARLEASNLNYPSDFLSALKQHRTRMAAETIGAA